MSQNTRVLIIVADGAHARFVRPADNGALHTVNAIDSAAAHKRSSDLGSDHPGAAMHSQSTAHHAMAPRHDPHALAEAEFARFVADEVNAIVAEGGTDHLLLAAPPRTLNAIRDHLSQQAASALTGTVGKDLVKTPDHELQPHLRQWLNLLLRYPTHEA